MKKTYALGIDLGTTTISAAAVCLTDRQQTFSLTRPNTAALAGAPFEHLQDPQKILEIADTLLKELLSHTDDVCAIGVTGQMHGIVYINADREPVSPLYTWQDERGSELYKNGSSVCDELKHRTGEAVPSGYGFTTHFCNLLHDLVPENAVSFCTIADLFVMHLTGKPVGMHPSNAASLGFFDPAVSRFKEESLAVLKSPGLYWPKTADDRIAGFYQDIPVTVSIGDNQAAFFGSVQNENNALSVNIGTGSQICFCPDQPPAILPPGIELRPYHNGKILLCGSALAGGRAYALIEQFFSDYCRACGLPATSQYEIMNRLAWEAFQKPPLSVETTFCGTRLDPLKRGAIHDISEENFTPGALILGTLRGIVEELAGLIKPLNLHPGSLTVSGNAVRKNPALQKLLEDMFRLPLRLPCFCEEAASGAALYAAHYGAGISIEEVKLLIPEE